MSVVASMLDVRLGGSAYLFVVRRLDSRSAFLIAILSVASLLVIDGVRILGCLDCQEAFVYVAVNDSTIL